ncbi:MAG TPA: restriction endonuclease subunit S [Candidatus Anaerobutyricum avicola]|nr:restriction endonuclease subunit S [Candidatus Anaerobutyricum avicola]
MNASLNSKLQSVKWGEYRLGELFEINPYKKKFDANKVTILECGKYPYIVRISNDNGCKGFINEEKQYLNEGNTLSFGQDTATVFYQKRPYFTGDKIKILKCKDGRFNEANAHFFVAAIIKAFSSFSWGTSSYSVDVIENQIIKLPTKNSQIDFDFMEDFIAELEAESIVKLAAYLKKNELDDYTLSNEEEQAIENYKYVVWNSYNLEKLFGKSTRGKRLKGDDRIPGKLPFVTAGEKNEGVSAYINNDVEVFEKNTITIDMFGSAKYRNYRYGADDHVAVVHTENLPMKAAIFVTSAIHKVAHTGKFDYGNNFYAKDADALDIMLPTKGNKPDYYYMNTLISAIQKKIVKIVVQYIEKKMHTMKMIKSHNIVLETEIL